MTTDEAIETLQSLLAASGDSESGFTVRARRLGSAELRAVIALRAEECERSTREMRALLSALGHPPVEVTRGSSAPRPWRLAGAAADGDDAVLEECEHEEERSLELYRAALFADPPPPLRALLQGELEAARRSAGLIRSLRERAREAA
jgi:uncharacterized protein (TIGR02284 family)